MNGGHNVCLKGSTYARAKAPFDVRGRRVQLGPPLPAREPGAADRDATELAAVLARRRDPSAERNTDRRSGDRDDAAYGARLPRARSSATAAQRRPRDSIPQRPASTLV